MDTQEISNTQPVNTTSSGNGKLGVLVGFLVVVILLLLGVFAFLFLTDRVDIGIKNPLSKEKKEVVEEKKEEEEEEVEESTVKMGKFALSMTYPSEFLPGYRVCFTDTKDVSKVYCFVDLGSGSSSSSLSNALIQEKGLLRSGSLPEGTYTMEYMKLDGVDFYVWNPCVKLLNGEEIVNDSACQQYYSKMNGIIQGENWSQFNTSDINSYGGEPIIIKIEEGKTAEIGTVALEPYISLEM